MRSIVDWLEDRTGLESALRHFLYEDIPASAGWRQVFGSVALFCFLIQVFTGILLAFNYAPTPGEAYNSVKYIMTEVTGGSMIRGLHHWGASMMIVVVVVHMTQVFIWGAYKKPREATWMVGVVLLLLTFAYGLTGYLLPWDNRAYWGTVVSTQIAAKAPIAGPYLSRLLGGSDGIGVVTFARFFSLHVLLLPPATMLLIAVHVFLVRKHGVTPSPEDTAPKKKFFPEQVFKDTIAIFGAFVILFCLAVVARVPLGQLADPTNTTYVPRPDWYFLFLFQTLKYFEGPLELLGTMILPAVAVMALFLVPFVDRQKVRIVRHRTTAIGIVLLAGLTWGGLTAAAIATTPKTSPDNALAATSGPHDWQQLTPVELAGEGYFRRENCASCHAMGEGGAKPGPDLAQRTVRRDASWMIQHFKQPAQMMPGTSMPPIHLTDSQLNMLAAFLLQLNAKNAKALKSAPTYAVEGAIVFQQSRCATCHQANGTGSRMGPNLNGLSKRRTKEWIKDHFLDPQKMSKGTIMPPYAFNAKDMENITMYLLSLPD